jgi:hypothetical protein
MSIPHPPTLTAQCARPSFREYPRTRAASHEMGWVPLNSEMWRIMPDLETCRKTQWIVVPGGHSLRKRVSDSWTSAFEYFATLVPRGE